MHDRITVMFTKDLTDKLLEVARVCDCDPYKVLDDLVRQVHAQIVDEGMLNGN